MNERLAQYVAQLRELWGQMPPDRRLFLTGAAGAVFVVLIVLALTLGGGGSLEVLFSNLVAADAAEVLQHLDELGIGYRIESSPDGRATILVPADIVYRTRIDLAAQGIPRQGSVGFEIFDETQLGMTDDVRRINLRRALNGELERTIRSLDVVEDARVQVALPENKLFISQQQEPSAAVLVTLRPGFRLSADQVRAIQRLVGATIEGMDPENVFVLDNRGNPLSDQLAHLSGNSDVSAVEKQLLIQQAVSSEYTRRIRSLLEGPFGVGAVEAMVNVEINFEKAEEIIKAFEAPSGNSGIVRSEQRLDETFTGTGAAPGGVPGVESNVPGYVGLIATGDSEYTRTEETINYEINQIETRRQIPPGAIKRVSVAVLIDGNLTSAQQTSVANTLTTALGLDPSRGDQVHVDSLPFVSRIPAGQTQERGAETLLGLPPGYLAVAAAALAALLLVYLGLRRRPRPAEQIDLVLGEEEEEQAPERKLSPEERRRQQMRDQVLAMAKQNPENIARLLKTWLTEE